MQHGSVAGSCGGALFASPVPCAYHQPNSGHALHIVDIVYSCALLPSFTVSRSTGTAAGIPSNTTRNLFGIEENRTDDERTGHHNAALLHQSGLSHIPKAGREAVVKEGVVMIYEDFGQGLPVVRQHSTGREAEAEQSSIMESRGGGSHVGSQGVVEKVCGWTTEEEVEN